MRGYSYLACLLFSVVVFMALGISTTQEEGFSYAAYTEPHALKNSIEVFGINSDKYSVHYDIIQPNQVLGEILGNCNINTAMVHEIAVRNVTALTCAT
ncbi:MAG: hypothetical protein IPL35_15940 [Sphingobacteriales bacterium]|nr:hypothetical protein [Sphingobacteriales bacterium]